MGAIKGIPYGMSNFTSVREQNCYYVDKTMYLPLLEEQAHYLILVRPRRFGKSLFLDMLRSYYDLSQKDKFQSLYNSFSADKLTKPDIFPSLLFFYGMLTIIGTRGDRVILGIPNNNVRKQYYEYLLEEFQSREVINLNNLKDLFDGMTFDGDWRPALEFIAQAYKENSSVRSSIEGERNSQGFFTAYLSINAYYLTMPEVEVNHGFCDMFLMPDLQRYPEIEHSYILELKYLSKDKFETQAAQQWAVAVEQIHGYAEGTRVRQLCQGTQLHCIVMQFCGWELARIEEV